MLIERTYEKICLKVTNSYHNNKLLAFPQTHTTFSSQKLRIMSLIIIQYVITEKGYVFINIITYTYTCIPECVNVHERTKVDCLNKVHQVMVPHYFEQCVILNWSKKELFFRSHEIIPLQTIHQYPIHIN